VNLVVVFAIHIPPSCWPHFGFTLPNAGNYSGPNEKLTTNFTFLYLVCVEIGDCYLGIIFHVDSVFPHIPPLIITPKIAPRSEAMMRSFKCALIISWRARALSVVKYWLIRFIYPLSKTTVMLGKRITSLFAILMACSILKCTM